MTRSSLWVRALALAVVGGMSSAAPAAADERTLDRLDRASLSGTAAPDALDVLPARCAAFAEASPAGAPDRPDTQHAWRQLLSLAACVQDGAVAPARDPGQLAAMVEDMSRRLALPMLIYVDALEHADAPIQLRAAFQIGMAYVALSTRARSAIAAPAGAAGTAAEADRRRELHARLEPMLATARRAAWVAFHAIDEAAADERFAADEVERNMVRAARQQLPGLRDAAITTAAR